MQAKMEKYPEVIYCQYQRVTSCFCAKHLLLHLGKAPGLTPLSTFPFHLQISAGGSDGDVFFFDYGVIACWGLEEVLPPPSPFLCARPSCGAVR